jgi:hypothetical protein
MRGELISSVEVSTSGFIQSTGIFEEGWREDRIYHIVINADVIIQSMETISTHARR